MRTLPLLLLLVGCAPAVVAHSVPPSDPALLSAWELFEDGATQVPAADVVPFLPNAPAISDHADKNRFVRIPPGTVIEVDGAGRWVFPVGTVIAKTFGFDGRVVETRIMARLEDGWTPYVYLWNEDETDAIRITEGADVPVTSVDPMTGERTAFDWHVSAASECVNCHGDQEGVMTPIALRTDQLEHGDQIDRFVARGLLAGRPTASSPLVDWHDESQPLEARARAYLHGNCASCHREAGMAAHTGVRLGIEITDAARLGICRAPTLTDASGSGGRPFVMSPGDPSQSVMAHRLESTLWGVHMPFGSTVIDEGGVELIEAWIEGMPSAPCPH